MATTAIKLNRSNIAKTGIIPGRLSLLNDVSPLKILGAESVISESKGTDGRKVLRVTGIYQKADEPNGNGRVYPKKILSEAVEAIQEDIAARSVIGELDHPEDAKLHLDRISHVITKVWMEGKYVYGVAEVLEDTPCGKILGSLLRNKIQLGISSRGVGDMEEIMEGNCSHRVRPGFRFVTWDMVGEPSVKEAVMHVMESKNRLQAAPTGGILLTRSVRKSNPGSQLMTEMRRYLSGIPKLTLNEQIGEPKPPVTAEDIMNPNSQFNLAAFPILQRSFPDLTMDEMIRRRVGVIDRHGGMEAYLDTVNNARDPFPNAGNTSLNPLG